MATTAQLRTYLGRLAVTLWNYGAEFPVPALEQYDSGEVGFEFEAVLPGPDQPKPALVRLVEVWAPSPTGYARTEYDYDFIEFPLNRRRSFHRHDDAAFLAAFGVTVHEHCEEVLGEAACSRYFGFPVDGFEAIRRFAVLWGQPGSIGCSRLRCMR